jgi:hypothetical protein
VWTADVVRIGGVGLDEVRRRDVEKVLRTFSVEKWVFEGKKKQ